MSGLSPGRGVGLARARAEADTAWSHRVRRTGWAVGGILLVAGPSCSDRVASPVDGPLPEEGRPLPELIVSDARGGGSDWQYSTTAEPGPDLAYVALPPGSLPTVETAGIRNLAGSGPAVTVPVVDGGFDPVAVPAAAGDLLELTLSHATGAVSVAYARVPPKRPPVVVRTYPTKGRTDVALAVIPTVIFSEPIEAGTLATGVRLVRGEEEVPVGVELGASPWEARVMPLTELEPGTDYELRITRDVQDLAGDALESALEIPFTTEAASLPVVSWGDSRLAFDRWSIILGQPDGTLRPLRHSSVCDTPSGYGPRLSPDGKRLLFLVSGMAPEYICVVDLGPGPQDRKLPWGPAAWSADGASILSVQGIMVDGKHRQELHSTQADGSGEGRVVSSSLPPDVTDLDVSPDGTIAFGTLHGEIWLMESDGSGLRRLGWPGLVLYEPDWAPDGSRIAYGMPYGNERIIGSMAADGSDMRIHFQPRAGERVHGPEWSPDGGAIAFALQASTGGGIGIYVVDLETRAVAQLVDGEAWSPSWAAVDP